MPPLPKDSTMWEWPMLVPTKAMLRKSRCPCRESYGDSGGGPQRRRAPSENPKVCITAISQNPHALMRTQRRRHAILSPEPAGAGRRGQDANYEPMLHILTRRRFVGLLA